MTISITVSQCSFEGDGSSVTFPIADGSNGIYFTSSDEIAVTVDGDTVSTSAYTVSGAGTDSGSITFTSAPADGTAGVIKRNTVITQGLSLTRGGYLPPTSVMESIDKLTRIDQDQQRQIDDLDTRVVDTATAAAGAAAAAVSATNAATSAAAAATSATSAATSATAAGASATSAASNLAVLHAIVENPGFDLAPGSYPLDDISAGFNGSATTFNLTFLGVAKTPASAGQLLVHLGSGHQIPTSAYTVSGSSITFADPPAAGLSCALLLIQIDTSDLAAAEAAAVAAATAAATSATGAATSASNAATSATAAAGSASNAATSASNAASSASSAATSESNAAASATAAQGYATAAAGYSESMAWGYTFDSATTDADPGAAKFRFDNAIFASATYLYISETADEGDIAALMTVWDDSSSTIKGTLQIRDPLTPTTWLEMYVSGSIVDAGTYRKIPISPIAAGGTLSNGATVKLIVTRNGDAGTGAVDSFNGRTGSVTPASGDYTASQITNTPAGNIAATTVQAALDELDGDKLAASSVSAFGLTLIDDADAATALTTLGVSAFAQTILDDANATAARATLALPTSTTAGRLARYAGTAGEQGQTSGLFEDASGNVGIGTTNPSLAPLQVSGSALATAAVFGSSAAGVSLIASDPIIGFNTYWNGGFKSLATGPASYIDGSGVFLFATAPSVTGQGTAQAFTERMRIDSTGNVGIGTSSPATSLDVNGPIKAKPYTVATLPAAATVGAGTMAYVTDALTAWAAAAGGTVTGGGANFSRVVSDATNWKQM